MCNYNTYILLLKTLNFFGIALLLRFPHLLADWTAQCARSDEGAALLHELGVQTHSLDPVLYFVPWLTFNDVSAMQCAV